mmetsp:Transcript_24750/g.38538  ORF Transcript_24750/g.38538 Transcript_24750/m.38538 type:complete len:136 (-) Transcript_24750:4-411(-)
MATIDYIENLGGQAANFLDLGGAAYHEKVTESLIMMEKDMGVDVIFLNMYCGQLVADKIAIVIKEAYERKLASKPIVIRLKGTNFEEANEIIKSIKLDAITCELRFEEATQTVVEMGKKLAEKREGDPDSIHAMV